MKHESCLQRTHSLGTNSVSFAKICTLDASFILYLLSVVQPIFDLYIYFCWFVLELHSVLSSFMGAEDDQFANLLKAQVL